MSHYGQSSQYYHFQIIFFEAAPGIVQMKYFDASDGGITCTVGVQRKYEKISLLKNKQNKGS